MKDLKGRVVLITGAGSGLGRQMALKFAREGSRIVIWDIHQPGMQEVAGQIRLEGGEAWTYACDVSDREQVYETARKVKQDVGMVEVLVNNAGVVHGKPFLESPDETVQKTIAVNLLGHFWTVKSFLPEMVQADHGHLVTIASAGGWIGTNALADYCASKFANVGFDESIRMELRKKGLRGVRTTCVCPYYIDTGMFQGVKTRFSFLLPILKEEMVADRIIKAVKKDQPMLKLPPLVAAVPLLRLLPVPIFDFLADLLGVSSSMEDFVGRTGAAVQSASVKLKQVS